MCSYFTKTKRCLTNTVKAARRWYQQAEFITWSRLATFGNNPLVKLTILAPLLAQVLIHKDTIAFLAKYDFKNIGYLYASLMCFSVAQLIYTFRCDRDVKDYPSEVRFTQALDATTSDKDLNIELFDEYKVFFKKYGGAIDEGKFDGVVSSAEIVYSSPDEKYTTADEIARSEGYEMLCQVNEVISSLKNGVQLKFVDWKLVRSCGSPSLVYLLKLHEVNGPSEQEEKTSLEYASLERWIDSSAIGSHWRAKALKRRYDKLNTNRLLARSISATLYALGSAYFVYTAIFNVYRVLAAYGYIDQIKSIIQTIH